MQGSSEPCSSVRDSTLFRVFERGHHLGSIGSMVADIATRMPGRRLKSSIMTAMWTHRIEIVLSAVAGLLGVWYCVRAIIKAAWRELSAYMRNQRFGE